jgi:hypothetical protein
MFKKFSLLALLAIIFLTGFDTLDLHTLTIVNKSGMEIAVRLKGVEEEELYYLPVPEGSRTEPTSRNFSIVEDTYSAQVMYIEYWDPVYGFQCSSAATQFTANRNVRMIVVECDRRVVGTKEPGYVKVPARPKIRIPGFLATLPRTEQP